MELPTLTFRGGTLELRGAGEALGEQLPAPWRYDTRTQCYRAPARAYATTLRKLGARHRVTDHARAYDVFDHGLSVRREPRPFQREALDAWQQAGRQGVVVLPTGAGKTEVALMALDAVRRSTVVVVPTLSLMHQWYERLRAVWRGPVGVVGGGDHRVEPVTVITYDSAYMHMEHLGHRFGLVVFDEVHHLPGDAFSVAAEACLAPFRLGLSATPERADGRHQRLPALVGPVVYRREVDALAGRYLAEYRVERIWVELTDEERDAYEKARSRYRKFVVQQGLRLQDPGGWQAFVMRSSRSAEGRAAMAAYQEQRRLAFDAPSKRAYVERLLHQHRHDKMLLFTDSNRTAYSLAQKFLLPVMTHQTPVTERSRILAGLAEGTYTAVVASHVLNEGIDLPAVGVGVVLSGSGSVRAHVQRLGRLLRCQGNKQAILYELVASDTAEARVSDRRRRHVAYQ